MHTQKGFAPLVWVLIAAIVLGGGYAAYRNYQRPTTNNPQKTQASVDTNDWKTYRNDKYGFEVKYPPGYIFTDKPGNNLGYGFDVQYEGAPFPSPLPRVVNFSAKENYIDSSSFSIYADNNANSLNYCLKAADSKDLTRTKEINGNKFYTIFDREGDAAMGGARGQVSDYHIIHNNNCYIIDFHVYWHEVGYGGYVRDGKNDATPEQSKGQREAIKKHTEALDNIFSTFKFIDHKTSASGLKTYANPEYGISFEYPAKYIPTEFPKGSEGLLPLFQYKDPNKKLSQVPDFIDVRWLPFKSDYSSESTLIKDVVYDGSGAHPSSFDAFTLVHLGENDFYKIRTGLFEGVLGYKYYLVKQDGAFVFALTSNGVPWTDPGYDPEKDPRHLELREILKTVKLNN